jgi:hypothetical protein
MYDQSAAQGVHSGGDERVRVTPQSAGRGLEAVARGTGKAVSESVDENLTAIAVLVGGLQAATAIYRDRPLDWGDVAVLGQVRDDLGCVVRDFSSAEPSAALHRAREIASEVRRFRPRERADR